MNFVFDLGVQYTTAIKKSSEEKKVNQDFYFGNYMNYKNQDSSLSLEKDDETSKKMNVRFLNDGYETWRYTFTGIIGLGINSEFVNYLMEKSGKDSYKIGFIYTNDILNNSNYDYDKINYFKISKYYSSMFFNFVPEGYLNNRYNIEKFTGVTKNTKD